MNYHESNCIVLCGYTSLIILTFKDISIPFIKVESYLKQFMKTSCQSASFENLLQKKRLLYAVWGFISFIFSTYFYFTDIKIYIYLCTLLCVCVLLLLCCFGCPQYILLLSIIPSSFYHNHTI